MHLRGSVIYGGRTMMSRHCLRTQALLGELYTRTPLRLTSRSAWKRWMSSRASLNMETPSTIAKGRNVVMGLVVKHGLF